MSKDLKRYIELCWRLLELKLMYYCSSDVHDDWIEHLTVPDSEYDALEAEYCLLAKGLGESTRLSHKNWHDYVSNDTQGIDEFPFDSPSGKLVLQKYILSKRQFNKFKKSLNKDLKG